jgi:hypothetical protein
MKIRLAIFCAIALGTVSASAQKPFPRGVMVVFPDDDPNLSTGKVEQAVWSDPNIIGVLLRTHWTTVEGAGRGTFDWSYFHEGLRLARSNNKFVVLSISAVDAPTWVTAVVQTWTAPSNQQHCPYPWDPNLQTYWNELVQSMGQTFDGDSLVQGVDMWAGGTGGGSASGIDCIFAPKAVDCTALDVIAGGGSDSGNTLWNDACKALCKMYLNAFPTTQCFLHPGRNYGDLDPQSMSNIATWWLNRFPGSNSLFFNGLSSTTPAYDSTARCYLWPNTDFCISSINNGMFQTVGAIPESGPSLASIFANVNAINAGGPFVIAVQIYPTDPATEPGEQTFISFNQSVCL